MASVNCEKKVSCMLQAGALGHVAALLCAQPVGHGVQSTGSALTAFVRPLWTTGSRCRLRSPLDCGNSGCEPSSSPSGRHPAPRKPSGRLLCTGACQPGLITLFYGKLYFSTWPGWTPGVACACEVVCPSTIGSECVQAGAGATAWREEQSPGPCSSPSGTERVTTVGKHA